MPEPMIAGSVTDGDGVLSALKSGMTGDCCCFFATRYPAAYASGSSLEKSALPCCISICIVDAIDSNGSRCCCCCCCDDCWRCCSCDCGGWGCGGGCKGCKGTAAGTGVITGAGAVSVSASSAEGPCGLDFFAGSIAGDSSVPLLLPRLLLLLSRASSENDWLVSGCANGSASIISTTDERKWSLLDVHLLVMLQTYISTSEPSAQIGHCVVAIRATTISHLHRSHPTAAEREEASERVCLTKGLKLLLFNFEEGGRAKKRVRTNRGAEFTAFC